MAAVAPAAEFQFIAHLPEWGLDFPIEDGAWGGALPTVVPQTGSTVWGAVFDVSAKDLEAINEAEADEHRTPSVVEAMDRNGKRHQVRLHIHTGNGNGNGQYRPSTDYLSVMLEGSRHWSLPAGWIAGLEEHLQDGN